MVSGCESRCHCVERGSCCEPNQCCKLCTAAPPFILLLSLPTRKSRGLMCASLSRSADRDTKVWFLHAEVVQWNLSNQECLTSSKLIWNNATADYKNKQQTRVSLLQHLPWNLPNQECHKEYLSIQCIYSSPFRDTLAPLKEVQQPGLATHPFTLPPRSVL